MTTCNDSFYYGLVNPQIQLCPIRPSAAHLFFSVFPLALLSVVHLGSCGPRSRGVCVWESSLALGEGKRQEWVHRGDFALDPQCCLACVQIRLNALSPPSIHIPEDGEMPFFFLLSEFLCFCQRNDKPLSVPTSAPAILSQPEVRRRRGCGNSLRTQPLLRGVASLCGIPVSSPCLMPLIFRYLVSSNNSAWKTTIFPDNRLRY